MSKLCAKCLADYKRSKEGKRARRLRKLGANTSWGSERWPAGLYHNGQGVLCANHSARSAQRVTDAYDTRTGALVLLGFESYTAYLESELWQSVRERCFHELGTICEFCPATATQIHHGRYSPETLSGETLRHLYPVCGICHARGEFETSGEKCSPRTATARMRRLACEAGNGSHVRKMERRRELVFG